MKPPFRADHVGSLLRPQALHAARARHKKGEIDRAALRAVEDECIRQAVKLQEDVGLQAVTDGEFRRDWWHIDFIHGFDGVDLTVNRFATFQGTGEQPPLFKVTGKIRRSEPSMLDHFKFLKSVVKKGTPKFTMPSPAMLHASGAYADFVAERVFTGLDVDGFFLEYDTERAGGFEPLRFVPKGKKVVLGLISSKFPELEKKDDLKRRIDAAARYVPMENLALSPQCGFSSTHHGNNLTEQQEVAKLKLCIAVAREVWG